MTKKQKPTNIAAAIAKAFALPEIFRVVAINFSGNTGKTTLCRHLLKPVMPSAELLRIESINDSGAAQAHEEFRGKEFEDVLKRLFAAEGHVIVDIGASNVEEARNTLTRLGDAHEEVDLWLVPCMQEPAQDAKMYKDTIATLKQLVVMGVDPQTIAVVKNKVAEVNTMDVDFAGLVAVAEELGVRVIDRPVLHYDVYAELDQREGALDEVAADQTDYRAKMREARRAGDDGAAEEAVNAEFRRKNAGSALSNLAKVREDLFEAYVTAEA